MVMVDPYVLMVEAASPLADTAVTLRRIAEQPLIGYRQCRSARLVEEHLRARGLEPRVVFRSDDNGTVQGLVRAGVGAALVPGLSADRNDDGVAVIDVQSKLPPRLIAMAWHRDRYRSAAARAFVETAKAVCDELAAAHAAMPVAG
jgi:DNA-binding transcriptional LysR family regulator